MLSDLSQAFTGACGAFYGGFTWEFQDCVTALRVVIHGMSACSIS